jgi:hypothetical protein
MKKSGILKTAGFIVFAALLQIQSSAQPGQHETVTVIGTYKPQLSEASKIGFTPEIKDSVMSVPKIDYRIVSSPIDVRFDLKPVPPAKMTGETFKKLYKNHIIAGIGNYWSPYIEFSHHSFRNKKFRGEIHLRHLSASGKLKDHAFPGYSENSAGSSVHYMLDNYTFSSGIEYQRDGLHYYGFLKDSAFIDFEKKDIKQVFSKFDFFVSGESNYRQKDRFHNGFKLHYQGLWDKYNMNEQNVLLGGNIKKEINIASFLKDETIFVDAAGGFFSQKYSLENLSTGLVSIKPYLKVSLDALELRAGGNVCMQLDSVGEIFLLPYGRLDLHIVPGSLGIFLGLDGEFERNTFRQLTQINPFLNTETAPLDYTISRNVLSGGVYGGFGGKFSYRLMAQNRMIDNMPLFVNDTLPFLKDTSTVIFGNRFTVVHDNVDVLTLSMQLQMNFNKKFTVEFVSAYNIFSPEAEAKAWHQPGYEGNLRFVYNLEDKIYGKFNLFAFGERYALVGNTAEKMDPVFDFNLEVEYRFNKNLGFWARFNNFTAKRHFYWNNYPSQRLNVMAGASYTF